MNFYRYLENESTLDSLKKYPVPIYDVVSLNEKNEDSSLKKAKNISISTEDNNLLFGPVGVRAVLESFTNLKCNGKLRISDSDLLIRTLKSKLNSDEPLLRIGDFQLEGTRVSQMRDKVESDLFEVQKQYSQINTKSKIVQFLGELLLQLKEDMSRSAYDIYSEDVDDFQDIILEQLADDIFDRYTDSLLDVLFNRVKDIDSFSTYFIRESSLVSGGLFLSEQSSRDIISKAIVLAYTDLFIPDGIFVEPGRRDEDGKFEVYHSDLVSERTDVEINNASETLYNKLIELFC